LVNLTWAAATDAESGVQFYNVYRGGTLIGTSIVTTFADTTVAAGQTYQYEVAAVNSANLEGPRSTAASVTVETVLSFQNGVFPTPAYTGTTDTWLEQENPTATHGNDTTINLDIRRTDSNANTAAWALIEFDVSAIPPGSAVESAVITLNITNTSSATFGVYASLREWSEAAANWNVYAPGQTWQPPGGAGPADRGTTVLGTFNPSAQGALSITLSAEGRALVESWIDDPNDNHGVMLHGSGTDFDGTQFTSSESTNAANRPRLTVAYSTGDTTPPVIIARQTALDIAPQRVEFIFSEDVSVDVADLVLVNNTTAQTISPGQMQVTFNTVTNAARWTFPGLPGGVLPSGQYTATLTTSSVTDTAGNPTTPNGLETLSFGWLQGDTNQDGTIDAADIDRLYDSFSASNTSPVVDLDGDGNVDQQDVDRLVNFIIGTRYGDADLDHDVDRTDLLTLVSNYGGSGGWAMGDFTGDNAVGLADLARQQQNFGLASAPSPTAASAILVGHAPQAESTKFRALRRSPREPQPANADDGRLSPAAVDSTFEQTAVGSEIGVSTLRTRRHARANPRRDPA
jgi:hypothetical protein